MKKIFLFLLPMIYYLPLLNSCMKAHETIIKKTDFLMGTICEIMVITNNKKIANQAIDLVFKEVRRIEKCYGHGKDTELAKINKYAGKLPVKISPELFKIIETAVKISNLTNGAFDITVGPLVDLWKIGQEKPSVPKESEIKILLPLINYKNIVLDIRTSTVFLKKSGMELDLGGIAKGYAVDRAAEILLQHGIKKGLINFGGDIRVFGGNKKGNKWRIGVQHPRNKNEIITVLEYNEKSIVTSGDYERYFVSDGVRYHHIFNPKTGYPAKGTVSVTIISNNAMIADALSTGIFVLGAEKGIKVVEKFPDTDAIIISETSKGHKITITENLKKQNVSFNY